VREKDPLPLKLLSQYTSFHLGKTQVCFVFDAAYPLGLLFVYCIIQQNHFLCVCLCFYSKYLNIMWMCLCVWEWVFVLWQYMYILFPMQMHRSICIKWFKCMQQIVSFYISAVVKLHCCISHRNAVLHNLHFGQANSRRQAFIHCIFWREMGCVCVCESNAWVDQV